MNTPSPASRPLAITVVQSPGCHFCDAAQAELAVLVDQGHAIVVTTVDARSTDGQALMRHHRAGLSPLVLVDDAFFSQGRLPHRKLSRLLQRRHLTPVTPATDGSRGA